MPLFPFCRSNETPKLHMHPVMLLTNPKNSKALDKMVKLYHTHELSPKQCSSMLVQTIDAPLPLVWCLVKKFDKPQCYKNFISSCTLLSGDGGVGSIREITLVSGFPGKKSIERFDFLDDEMHVCVFSVVEADHSFLNFKSTITLHEDKEEDDCNALRKTVVIESYVVDIPENSCKDDTCEVTDNILGWQLRSLAWVAENMATSGVSPSDLKKTEISC